MVSLAKKIAMTSQEMVGKSGVNPAELGSLANQLTRDYDLLASNSAGAAEASSSPDVSNITNYCRNKPHGARLLTLLVLPRPHLVLM